jgi:hypothetical protein
VISDSVRLVLENCQLNGSRHAQVAQQQIRGKIAGMKRKKREQRRKEGASYVCNACGEEATVLPDLSAGKSQEYVEDCPVCCRPNVIHVEIEQSGTVRVWAEAD